MHSKYNSDEQTEKNEMGGACSMREKNHLEDPDVQGRLLKRMFKKWDAEHGLD